MEGGPQKAEGPGGHAEQADLPSLSALSFQKGDVDPRPPWTPCTRPWLAVSSCGESPRHPPPQLPGSPASRSAPADVTGLQTSLPGSTIRPWSSGLPSETPEPPDVLSPCSFRCRSSRSHPGGCWISPCLRLLPLPSDPRRLGSCTARPRIPCLGSWSLPPPALPACLTQADRAQPPGHAWATGGSHIPRSVEDQAGLGGGRSP